MSTPIPFYIRKKLPFSQKLFPRLQTLQYAPFTDKVKTFLLSGHFVADKIVESQGDLAYFYQNKKRSSFDHSGLLLGCVRLAFACADGRESNFKNLVINQVFSSVVSGWHFACADGRGPSFHNSATSGVAFAILR